MIRVVFYCHDVIMFGGSDRPHFLAHVLLMSEQSAPWRKYSRTNGRSRRCSSSWCSTHNNFISNFRKYLINSIQVLQFIILQLFEMKTERCPDTVHKVYCSCCVLTILSRGRNQCNGQMHWTHGHTPTIFSVLHSNTAPVDSICQNKRTYTNLLYQLAWQMAIN